ncbi:MAG: metal-dependent hydrolase [Anaerolineales bacterium]
MAQAGIHALLGMTIKPLTRDRSGLLLGVILGNLLPDADNLLVAGATLMSSSTEGLHRTFTHSFISVGVLLLGFYLAGMITGKKWLTNLGIGLAIGMVMHILVDLLVWFDGVQILWPLPMYVNLWTNVTPPVWFSKLMMPTEFLFMAWYLAVLRKWAAAEGTDPIPAGRLRVWIGILLALFAVFTVLVYVLEKGFMTPFGALYLVMLGVTAGITIRMRKTIDQVG